MARFQPGQTKLASSGRKRGTPNKRTSHLEEILASLDTCVPEKIVQLLPELSPEKRVDVLLELMSYLYPKRKAVERVDVQTSLTEIQRMSSGQRKERIHQLSRALALTEDEQDT